MQFLYHGVTVAGEPGCLLTFEEFPQHIYRDAGNFGWDFRALEREGLLKVVFTSPDTMRQDLQRHDGLLATLIRDIGAKRLVVDSISHFRRLAPDRAAFRDILYGVINALKREGLTTLLIRELGEGDPPAVEVEDYVADTVIHLTHERIDGQRVRFMDLIKSRGTASHGSRSLMLIDDHGLRVIPPFRPAAYTLADAAGTGLPELDALLGGGIPYGGLYLLESTPTWPRHLLELNFLHAGLERGERVVALHAPAVRAHGALDLAERVGWAGAFTRAAEQNRFVPVVLNGLPPAETLERLGAELRVERRTRGTVDLNEVRGASRGEPFITAVRRLQTEARANGAAVLACLNTRAVSEPELDELRDAAEGILRIRQFRAYHFLQVCKSVTAAVSDPLPLVESPEPPFLHLAQY